MSIKDIFEYCECDFSSRNYTEGEAVLNANHIILVGETPSSDDFEINIFSLVLQTSALTGHPHEVKGTLIKEIYSSTRTNKHEEKLKIEEFKCSCKAGAGEKCKHIVSVLLYLYRNGTSTLDKISTTDMKCWWNERKGGRNDMYDPKPIDTFCCVKDLSEEREVYRKKLTPELMEEFALLFEKACPTSTFSRY